MVTIPQEPDRAHPDYPEYPAIRAEATRRSARPVHPGRLNLYWDLLLRPDDWASRVLGFPCGHSERLNHCDAETLAVAAEQNVDPPAPTWLIEARQRAAVRRQFEQDNTRRVAARHAAQRSADVLAWEAAQRRASVDLIVYLNPTGRPRNGLRHLLGHAVPAVDVYSGARTTRVHRAGRALCESPDRPRPLLLEDTPSTDPATCNRCLVWTAKVRPIR